MGCKAKYRRAVRACRVITKLVLVTRVVSWKRRKGTFWASIEPGEFGKRSDVKAAFSSIPIA
jgi:hypothetical protein